MDPGLVRKLIADEVDVITPATEMDSELYKHCRCPICGTQGAQKVTSAPKVVQDGSDFKVIGAPFSKSSPIVQGRAKCTECSTEYSPTSGVVSSVPDVPDPTGASL